MDTERIVERVARDFTGALSGGLWDYYKEAWGGVTKDLMKALNSAFGSNAKPGFFATGNDSAYVVMEGYTRVDFRLKVTVHIIGMNGNKYKLIVSAKRPDWGKDQITIIDEQHPNANFDAKKIAKRVAEQTI